MSHTPDQRAKIDQLVSSAVGKESVNSVAWLVTDGNGTLSSGFGGQLAQDYSGKRYRIASMSKSFLAAATLILRDNGQLQLSDPVIKYLPQLNLKPLTDDSPEVTIRDLLMMTSGLPTDDPWADRLLDVSGEEFDRVIKAQPNFAHPTALTVQYSNLGYVYLGQVISTVSGQSFQDFISNEVIDPLNLKDTGWHANSNSVKGYRKDTTTLEPALADGGFAALGGLWSTVEDIGAWMRFFLDSFPARDGSDDLILRRSSRREMQLAQFLIVDSMHGNTQVDYGYGLARSNRKEKVLISHSGGLPGFGSNMSWLPELGIGSVVLSNGTYWSAKDLNAEILDYLSDFFKSRSLVKATKVEVSYLVDGFVSHLKRWQTSDFSLPSNDLFSNNFYKDYLEAELRDLVAHISQHDFGKPEIMLHNNAEMTLSFNGKRILIQLSPETEPRIQAFKILAD